MDFYNVLKEVDGESGQSHTPYGAKIKNVWQSGTISIDFLNENYGQYSTAEEMINATESEGLKQYFQYLKDEGILN